MAFVGGSQKSHWEAGAQSASPIARYFATHPTFQRVVFGSFAGVVTVGAIVGAVVLQRQLWNAKAAVDWPRVEATVLISEAETNGLIGKAESSRWNLSYRYTAGDKEHTGTAVAPMSIKRRYAAWKSLADAHPPGSQLDVAVNPDDPAEAYPLTEITLANYIAAFAPIAVALIFGASTN